MVFDLPHKEKIKFNRMGELRNQVDIFFRLILPAPPELTIRIVKGVKIPQVYLEYLVYAETHNTPLLDLLRKLGIKGLENMFFNPYKKFSDILVFDDYVASELSFETEKCVYEVKIREADILHRNRISIKYNTPAWSFKFLDERMETYMGQSWIVPQDLISSSLIISLVLTFANSVCGKGKFEIDYLGNEEVVKAYFERVKKNLSGYCEDWMVFSKISLLID